MGSILCFHGFRCPPGLWNGASTDTSGPLQLSFPSAVSQLYFGLTQASRNFLNSALYRVHYSNTFTCPTWARSVFSRKDPVGILDKDCITYWYNVIQSRKQVLLISVELISEQTCVGLYDSLAKIHAWPLPPPVQLGTLPNGMPFLSRKHTVCPRKQTISLFLNCNQCKSFELSLRLNFVLNFVLKI